MPNPLSAVHPSPSIMLGNVGMGSPLNHNPELALYAMEVVRTWSDVENFRLNLFMEILGRENEHAKIAFLALEADSAKNASIRAVAERALGPDMMRVFTAVQKIAKRHQKTRNRICHWTWGYSPDIVDGFLLVDPKAIAPDDTLRHHLIYVYKKSDFEDTIRGNERVAGYMQTMRFITMGHVANNDGQLENELLETEEIRALLT